MAPRPEHRRVVDLKMNVRDLLFEGNVQDLIQYRIVHGAVTSSFSWSVTNENLSKRQENYRARPLPKVGASKRVGKEQQPFTKGKGRR
jgi:hypothetical protein